MTKRAAGVLAPGAAVWCTDGRIGRLSDVVIDPVDDVATDLVVEPLRRYRPKRRIPLWMVESFETEDGQHDLRVGLDQVHYAQLQRVLDGDFVRIDTPPALAVEPWRVRFQTCLIPPYFEATEELVAQATTTVSTRDCEIRRGATVMGVRGNQLGLVVGFAVDGADIVALAVRTGTFGQGVDVAVPFDLIVGRPGDVVFLSISVDEFRRLPTIDVVPRRFALREFVHHRQDAASASRSALLERVRTRLGGLRRPRRRPTG